MRLSLVFVVLFSIAICDIYALKIFGKKMKVPDIPKVKLPGKIKFPGSSGGKNPVSSSKIDSIVGKKPSRLRPGGSSSTNRKPGSNSGFPSVDRPQRPPSSGSLHSTDAKKPGIGSITKPPRQSGIGGTKAPRQPGIGGTKAPRQPGIGGTKAPRQPGIGGTKAPRQPGSGGTKAPRQPGSGGTKAPRQPGSGGTKAPRQPEAPEVETHHPGSQFGKNPGTKSPRHPDSHSNEPERPNHSRPENPENAQHGAGGFDNDNMEDALENVKQKVEDAVSQHNPGASATYPDYNEYSQVDGQHGGYQDSQVGGKQGDYQDPQVNGQQDDYQDSQVGNKQGDNGVSQADQQSDYQESPEDGQGGDYVY